MQKNFVLLLSPEEAADAACINRLIEAQSGVHAGAVTGFIPIKQSIDARGRKPQVRLSLLAFINEPPVERPRPVFEFPDVSRAAHTVVIVGAGPAGLFTALKLLTMGIRPVVLERGKDVRERRRDLATLNREGWVNPDSNYCFGEGGAGTYSDGKLYTRSSKRGDVHRILDLFVHFGADEKILYHAHPHIGTNKLPQIIAAMREQVRASGGEVHFGARVTDIEIRGGKFAAAHCMDGRVAAGEALVLATGHSARDIFELLHRKRIAIEAKPFALGCRVEHPQSLIDSIQYRQPLRSNFLPAAAYSWVEQVDARGVFSFCMCPGGIIAPAATAPGEIVVNGWSPSKRNNPFANSGIVVSVNENDARGYFKTKKNNTADPLILMRFQQAVEQQAFQAGGGKLVAPAQRLADFVENRLSSSLPPCSYLPGIQPSLLSSVLPGFIYQSLQRGFRLAGKKMKGYLNNDAVVVATESRTSSPVRIPRDPQTLEHPQVRGLYPCAEGAGYAGGIMSAAMDGEKIAVCIASKVVQK